LRRSASGQRDGEQGETEKTKTAGTCLHEGLQRPKRRPTEGPGHEGHYADDKL
jgi:hypothetical protein